MANFLNKTKPRAGNALAANTPAFDLLRLSVESSPIYQHGVNNLATGGYMDNDDGSFSTVRSGSINVDGREMLIPTVYDKRQVGWDEAISRARASGVDWPTFDTPEEAEAYSRWISHNLAGRR